MMEQGRFSVRLLLRFLFSAIGLLVASYLVTGIQHGPFLDLVAVAVLLGALNATLGLLLKFMAFVPLACSFGCLSLFINGLVFWFAGWIAGNLGLGFRVAGFWSGFFGALVSSVVATILEWIFLGRNQPPQPEGPRHIKQIN
jgi:putative membrane protein